MAAAEPEDAFKITDRRRRGGDEPAPPAPAPPPGRVVDPGRSLVGLFAMLGEYAAAALGEVDPATGDHDPPDLAAAAEVIDTLITLREKTEGRRSPEESQALDALLYELQLRYVSVRQRLG